MESAVREAARRMGYFPLKEEQEASIMAFLKGCDVFVVLPTGFGKTFLSSNHRQKSSLRLGKTEALAGVSSALLLATTASFPQPMHFISVLVLDAIFIFNN